MITLNGGYGRGSVYGSFYLPDREQSGKGWCKLNDHLDVTVPPSDWYLPPPDSVWYDVVASPYGPRLATLQIGDIQSVDTGEAEWNPCKHTTLSGNALYLGDSRARAPYWRILSTNPTSAFTASGGPGPWPALQGRFLAAMRGRPCTASDPKLRNRYGDLIVASLSSSNDGAHYYSTESILSGDMAPENIQSTLLQFGYPYHVGHWYAKGYLGHLALEPYDAITWYRTDWERPNRTTFIRDQYIEYHDDSSYTPAASKAWTEYPFLIEANHRITTCKVTHVRSDSPGRFQVKYDHTTDLSWFGWIPYDYFFGSKRVTTEGLISAVLVLEPGLTAELDLDLTKANNYCALAKDRASVLYDPKQAAGARTSAVRDVQELDSNWLENLAGVKGTMDCINPLLDGYKAFENGEFHYARKALAGSYLVYKYVVAPSISDYANVKSDGSRILNLASTNRFSNERRRGKAVFTAIPVCETQATLSYFVTLHLELRKNYFSQVWNALEKLGIDPSAGQIWDLIPFSFVADWYLPLGDTLRNIDSYNSLVMNRDLRGRIESFKVQWPVEEQVLKDLFDGNVCSIGKPIEYSWYDRRVYGHLGLIDPVSISDNNGLSSSQMVQGTALITQMLR